MATARVPEPTDGPPAVVLHLPHASRWIPDDARSRLFLSDEALEAEVLRMTDHATDRLYACPPETATSVVYPVSRLVCDPERFEDDAHEPMARLGMGAIYTRTHALAPLRDTPSDPEREAILSRWYRPHHARLSAAVDAALAANGHCLLIDGHSFPSRPLPYEQSAHRPALCIGTDAFHTPAALRAVAEAFFGDHGWTVAVDDPFAGALVPMRYYGRESRVTALMLEVRRDLYCDEASGEPHAGLAAFNALFRQFVEITLKSLGGIR